MSEQAASPARREQLRAWAIHIFTALGAVTGFMSLVAVAEGRPSAALIWLGVSMVIDGLDGPLARYFTVTDALPRVDGVVLDHVIDYMTYAVIPALFLYQFAFLPEGLNLIGAAAIMMTSLYCFANRDAKTKDNFFAGFPAAWNLIVLCFFLLQPPGWLTIATVVVCAVLTFVPITFIHPFRVKALRPLTLTLTAAWSAVTLAATILQSPGGGLWDSHPALLWAFIPLSAYFVAVSFIRAALGKLEMG